MVKLNTTKMDTPKYKLKDKAFITMNAPDWKEDLIPQNLTDKKAEALLNRSLKYIKFFEIAPNIEQLRKQAEMGVKTLNEAMYSKSDSEDSFFNSLTALKGIGKSTAEKIVNVYPTKDLLIDALENEVDMAFLGKFETSITKALKEIK